MFVRSACGYIYELSVEHSYRMYVTKQLVASANGKTIGVDWSEMVTSDKRDVTREDGEAVVRDIVTRAGLVVR